MQRWRARRTCAVASTVSVVSRAVCGSAQSDFWLAGPAACNLLATCTRRPSHLQATLTRGLENRQGRGCLRAETRGGTHTCCLAAPGCLRGLQIQMASRHVDPAKRAQWSARTLDVPGGRAPRLCNSTRPRPRGEGPTCTRRRAAQSPAPGGPHHSNVPGRCLPREDRSDARQSRILV